MNRKNVIFTLLLALIAGKAASQVRDVTFTVSPGVTYTWWNDNMALDDNTWVGLGAGFGFGPLFELRAFYHQANKVGYKYLLPLSNVVTVPTVMDGEVDLSRYGGEMRFNLMQGTYLAPYISVAGGVQKMKYALPLVSGEKNPVTLKEEQLFGALGLGTKFYLSDRVSLSLEARNTFFGMDITSPMLSSEHKLKESGEKLRNWSAAATLDFYLGGSNLDRGSVAEAYRRLMSDGFSGMKFVLEPGGAYVDFNDELPFENHYLLGGSAGFDFSSLVGIRGFYYRSTKEVDKLTFSLGDYMSMYGGNLIARLNHPRGVSPYLQLGGGYLKVEDGYVPKAGKGVAESQAFAFGGAGLEIPLSRYVAFFGAANAMLTTKTGVKETDVSEPSQVKTSMMYNAGLRFNLGRSARGDADAFYTSSVNAAVEDERAAHNRELNAMRADYEARLLALEEDRIAAQERGDIARAERLRTEQSRLIQDQYSLDRSVASGDRVVRMSSDDLARLVDRVVSEVRTDMRYQSVPSQGVIRSEDRSEEMYRLQRQNDELSRKLDDLNNRLNDVSRKGSSSNETIVIEDRGGVAPIAAPITTAPGGYVGAKPRGGNRAFVWNRLGVYTGPGFGDLATWNIGVRGYMQISNTSLDFVPEFYAAMGKKSGLGLSGNVIWNVDRLLFDRFTPYVGLGLGVFHGAKTHVGTNIIVGSTLEMGSGAIFVDYSIRSLFKQNQLAVGYRFVF